MQARHLARRAARQPGRAPRRRPGASRPAGARARRSTTSGKLRTVITVDDVRRTVAVLRLDRGRGRLARLHRRYRRRTQYRAGANALLKVLEEPPPRALFLWSAMRPAALLPTIRSRCRRLTLRPLGERGRGRARRPPRSATTPTSRRLRQAAAAADGSVARADRAQRRPAARAARAGDRPARARCRRPIRARCTRSATASSAAATTLFEIFVETVQTTGCQRRLDRGGEPGPARPRRRGLGPSSTAPRREAEIYNLERKPLVFNVFGLLAEAARG